MEALQAAEAALTERCAELQSERTGHVLQPASGCFFGHDLEWAPLQTPLPQRCGHHAFALAVSGAQVMVVLGGVARNEAHSTTLVVTGLHAALPGTAHCEVQVHLASANTSAALARREYAACVVSRDSLLVAGGLTDDGTAMEFWLGRLSCDDGAIWSGV